MRSICRNYLTDMHIELDTWHVLLLLDLSKMI